MSGSGNCEVCLGVIYDWNTGGNDLWKRCVLSLEWKRVGMIDGDSGDMDENGGLAWPRKWNSEKNDIVRYLEWATGCMCHVQTTADKYQHEKISFSEMCISKLRHMLKSLTYN